MNWYCVYTKPKKEDAVATFCRDALGLEVYYPRFNERKTIRRVRRTIVSPLFPGYFFCRFDLASHYRAVRYAPDAIGLVSNGDMPVHVDGAVIQQVKEWAGETASVQWRESELRKGEKVEIQGGPLQGMMGVVLSEMSGSERIAVLLSICNCDARTVLSRAQVCSQENSVLPSMQNRHRKGVVTLNGRGRRPHRSLR